MTPAGRDYKLTVSFLYRPFHKWQLPIRTSTGWCLGRIGVHYRTQCNQFFT